MTFDETEVELRVGETLLIGQVQVTVIEIEEGEVVFQVDDPSPEESPAATPRPR